MVFLKAQFHGPRLFLIFIAISILITTLIYYLAGKRVQKIDLEPFYEQIPARDFIRYPCTNRKRIGGALSYINSAKSNLSRIDGAWYVCFDDGVKPKENDCTVLSFGIKDDDTFDDMMQQDYNCDVHSFDPFIEPDRIKALRNATNTQSAVVKINSHWFFYKMGIVGEEKLRNKEMLFFHEIVEYLHVKNRVIDVFKMDIEGGEFDIIENIDIDYLCTYVKQFVLETHLNGYRTNGKAHSILKKLEKCFSLFHRDHRFFYIPTTETEWTVEGRFDINLRNFINETDLAINLFTFGELYFLNRNYL